MKRPKLIVLLLAAGVLLLAVGSVVAATRPSWPSHKTASVAMAQAHPSATPSPSPAAPTVMPGHTPASTPRATTAAKKPRVMTAQKKTKVKKAPVKSSITYVVKPGDTLSGIAEWFKLHGYGALYNANRSVIGSNPNLIFPGEHITITDGVMKLSGTRS
jgi:nucleoid-associated protein YgaU